MHTKTIERLVQDVGGELAQRRDTDVCRGHPLAQTPADPPNLAVVECDGGRIRTREAGQGPGVHLETEGWRETKNACLVRAQRQTFDHDPQPEPPEGFSNPRHVAKIAESEALSVASPVLTAPTRRAVDAQEGRPVVADWRPKRLLRTVLSSMAEAKVFGRQMAGEAKRRRFHEARAKAFFGGGLPWNWSIWKKHLTDFTPILDFIHPLSYLYVTSKALHSNPDDAWSQYLVWMRGCWEREVRQVLEELAAWQKQIGQPPDDAPDNDPRRLLAKTITYLEHNAGRMDYPTYRQQGLPVTTAWMESLVKEINYRVKGMEMFWNNPQGAEAILQVRAAALCDDGRLAVYLHHVPAAPSLVAPKAPYKLSKKN